MFFDLDIKADLLPPKTICLTYDDGPGETCGAGAGPRTRDLGRFLFEQGIPATFFVLGRHAEAYPDLLAVLRGWGHLIGNHTYTHPGLVGLALAGGDVVCEVERADALLRQAGADQVTFLRAPYGNWREKLSANSAYDKPTSIVAERLNRSARFPSYVGPINWDISSLDWEFWGRGDTAEQCALACLERVERAGRGILLMHDSSEDAAVRANNRTEQTTRLLVAALRERDYRFIGLDAIPQVRSAARVSALIQLRAANGDVVHRTDQHTFCLAAPTTDPALPEQAFGVEALGEGRVALRSSSGQYLSVAADGDRELYAGPLVAGAAEALRFQPRHVNRITVQTSDGRYLARDPNGLLRASASDPQAGEQFLIRRRA